MNCTTNYYFGGKIEPMQHRYDPRPLKDKYLAKDIEHLMNVYSHFTHFKESEGQENENGVCNGEKYEFVNYNSNKKKTGMREEMHLLLLMRAK